MTDKKSTQASTKGELMIETGAEVRRADGSLKQKKTRIEIGPVFKEIDEFFDEQGNLINKEIHRGLISGI